MDERSKIEFVVGNKSFYGQEIRKKGQMNIDKVYKSLIPWFKENKYLFHEKGITGKEKLGGREEKIEWIAERKIDSYFKFHIDTEFVLLRIRGENAELTLRFKGYLEKDYRNNFAIRYGAKFGEFLRRLYEKYVIKAKISGMEGRVWAETYDYIDTAKKELNLLTR